MEYRSLSKKLQIITPKLNGVYLFNGGYAGMAPISATGKIGKIEQ